MIVPFGHVLFFSAAMFCLGLFCVLARRNLILMLIGVEVMLNAVGLTAVGASALWGRVDGQVFAVFLMAVAAAEVAIALALVVVLKRRKGTLDPDAFDGMKG